MVETTQQQLEMLFDGDAVRDGVMNVRDLAPSMLGLGTLFEAANRMVNGSRATVNVNVRATSQSSFHILFEVNQLLQNAQQGATFSGFAETAANIVTLLFTGSLCLMAIIKKLNGKTVKIDKVNDSMFKITVGQETFEIPLALLRLYQDVQTRRAIADMVAPVKRPGIDQFQIRDTTHHPVHTVDKADVDAYDVPNVKQLLSDTKTQKNFSIIRLAFKEDNKWTLSDGENEILVSMKDPDFQDQVDKNAEGFFKDDILFVELRTIQWQVQDKLQTEYEVLKVISHKQARQLPLLPMPTQDTEQGGQR